MFLEASTDGTQRSIAIAVARFNADITDALLNGALQCLAEAGVAEDHIDVARVPGAFELPIVCGKMARTGRYDAVIALGCVIRGDTPHFDFVAGECARGCMSTSLESGVPVVFGVLTTDTLAQAQHRAARDLLTSSDTFDDGRETKVTPRSNKGAEAAAVALELASLLEQIH
ncbi:MAG: 6,7-dimethyl-8-ribityllumazine synthase [Planctomycetes bacterium]|nr:6,7-dimethyl-8-ribityllumazine synthase [Planctomycetota bacterium]